jgi:hypothetical protein
MFPQVSGSYSTDSPVSPMRGWRSAIRAAEGF